MDGPDELPGNSDPAESVAGRSRILVITCALLLIGACCVLAAAGVLFFADPFDWNLVARLTGRYDAAAEAMPADVDLYAGLDLLQLRSGDADRTFRAFAEQSPDAGFSSADELLETVDDELTRELGISLAEDILPWVGRHAGLSFRNLDPNALGSSGTPEFLFAAAVRDRVRAEAFVNLLGERIAEQTGGIISEETYNGSLIFSAFTPGSEEGIAFSLNEGVFIISPSISMLRASIDAKKGAAFMDSESFRRLAGELPRDRVLSIYVQETLLGEITGTAGLVLSGSVLRGGLVWKAWGAGLSFVDAGVMMDVVMLYDEAAISDLQRELIEAYAVDVRLDNLLPERTLAFLGGRRLDLTWQLLREQMAGTGSDFDESMAALAAEIGFNPSTDLFPYLDGEYGLAVLPGSEGFLAAEGIDLGLALLFETSNAAGLQPVLEAFDALVAEELGLPPRMVDVQGISVRNVSAPFVGDLLAYGLADQLLFLATSAGTVQDILTSGPDLAASEAYAAAWTAFPEGMKPVLFIDVAGLLAVAREGMDPDDLPDFEEEVAGVFGPVEMIAAANAFSGPGMQRLRVIVFVSGGTE